MPILSVVVPVYNVEAYLRDCLDSIINQTFQDMEIICVNDGSTDNSLSILNEYASKDTRIKVISQENSGAYAARNTGIDIATGTYIAFCDSDDMLYPNAYEEALKCFSDDIDSVCFEYTKIYDKSLDAKQIKHSKGFKLPYNGKLTIQYNDLLCGDVVVWNKVYRISSIKKYSLYFLQSRHAADVLFNICFFFLYNNTFLLNKPLYKYRIRNGSIMRHVRDKGIAISAIKAMEDVYQFLVKNNILPLHIHEFVLIYEQVFMTEYENSCDSEKLACLYEAYTFLNRIEAPIEKDSLFYHINEGNYTIIFGNKKDRKLSFNSIYLMLKYRWNKLIYRFFSNSTREKVKQKYRIARFNLKQMKM